MLVRTIPANGVLFGLVESTEPIIKRTLFNWRKNEKMLIVPPIQVFTQVFVISAMWLLAPYYTTHYFKACLSSSFSTTYNTIYTCST